MAAGSTRPFSNCVSMLFALQIMTLSQSPRFRHVKKTHP
jgi:hypothetical protein